MLANKNLWKLFVGCLVTTVTEDQIRASLQGIGEVGEINIVRDQQNLCKGFAFVTIGGNEENMKKALQLKTKIEDRELDIT